MQTRLEAARAAVHEVYVAQDAMHRANLHEDGALGVWGAHRAWQRLQDARHAAVEALELVPNIGEVVSTYNRLTGYELCDDTRGHLERLVWLREAHLLLDDFRVWAEADPDPIAEISY